MPASAALGVALAAITLLLAFLPERIFEAGCDARSELVTSGSCTQVEAADAAPDTPSETAASADPAAQ